MQEEMAYEYAIPCDIQPNDIGGHRVSHGTI
jgi:hypothetical protein